jgi:ribosomal protein S18 acetylase RimI-like enzyme
MIHKAALSDSFKIAEIHQTELKDSFLAALGESFLQKLYNFLIEKEIVFVERNKEQVVGFISGSNETSGLIKRFILYNPTNLFYLIIYNLGRPSLLKKLIETAIVPSKFSKKDTIGNELPNTELLSIAVDSTQHKKGSGSKLLLALETEFKSYNITNYKVIAGEKLVSANRFYQKHGFRKVTQMNVHGNEVSNIYVKDL